MFVTAAAACNAVILNTDAPSSSAVVVEDGLDDDALVSVLPLDGASSTADTRSVSAVVSHRQLRRLVSRDDPSLPTERLLPATDRSADVRLSTSVGMAKYPESGLLRSSWMLEGDGRNSSKSPSPDCSLH